MKKYVKPELVFERYELTEQIAACGWDLNITEGTCGFKGDSSLGQNSEWVILTGEIAGCEIKDYQAYCYQTDVAGMNTFNS